MKPHDFSLAFVLQMRSFDRNFAMFSDHGMSGRTLPTVHLGPPHVSPLDSTRTG